MAWKSPVTLLLCLVFNSCGFTIEGSLPAVGRASPFGLPLEGDASLALKLNDFGYRLLLQLSRQEDAEGHNAVLGPTSLAGLLGMTLMGTVGDTHDEIAHSVGFSQDILLNRKNHKAFGELLRLLASNATSSRTIYANAIFVDVNQHIRPLYREFLQRVYGGDAVSVDFEDQTSTLADINEWVKNHTQGAISEFLKQPLPTESKAVLLSAHYFSGQWANPFIPEYTKAMAFLKPNGESVMCQQMLNFADYKYVFSHHQGFHMVQLPYNDSSTSMYLLKPRNPRRLGLSSLLASLDWATIERSITQMQHEPTVVRLPKMAISARAELRQALRALGIDSLFVNGKANFALMLEQRNNTKTEEELLTRLRSGDYEGLTEQLRKLRNPGLHVDKVVHDVKITVDEYGTEAVAVSAGILARSANMFYADTPFLFFIKDENSGLVTFSAIINDPLE